MATAEEYHWPCQNCGADLRYAPGQTSLVCDHCGHAQEIEPAGPRRRARSLGELPLAQGLADDLPGSDMVELRTVSCPSCGALVEFDGAEHARDCPFCATPVVVDTGLQRQIKPQAVLPFVLTEEQARRAMISWMGSLWFAPGGLLEYARKGRPLNGMYVPFWTFDAETTTDYTGQRGENYTETRNVSVTVNGKRETRTETVTRTRWYPASGRVSRDFDDVLVMAARSLPQRLGNELTPWDLAALEPYSPDFLAGFRSEAYTIVLADGHEAAKGQMEARIRSDIHRDIGGDSQQISTMDVDYRNPTFKHILLPIWMAAYKYNGRSYQFLVNGQTGEVQGERPWSVWKIGFAVLCGMLVVLTVLYLNDPEAFRPLIEALGLQAWLLR